MGMNIVKHLADLVPMYIDQVNIADPFFTLNSDKGLWYLAVACPWRLVAHNQVLDSEVIDSLDPLVELLQGRSIVKLDLDDDFARFRVFLSGERVLTLLPDTDVDPWVFQHERLPVVLVGSNSQNRE